MRHPGEEDHPLQVHLRADFFQTGERLDELPGHIHHVEDALGADDERLRNPRIPCKELKNTR